MSTSPLRAILAGLRNPRLALLADERGATAIEYALLAAMLAILAIGGLQALSGGTGGLYATMEAISNAIEVALDG
jgi:pilus assembly protein Flp/PilA